MFATGLVILLPVILSVATGAVADASHLTGLWGAFAGYYLVRTFGGVGAWIFIAVGLSALTAATLAWNRMPIRLLILEGTAFIFGVSVLAGLFALLVRRLTNPRVRATTTPMDVAIELLLLAQVVLGCWIAMRYRWGSSWFAAALSPYLWSLAKLQPETTAVFALPWAIKLHIAGAFLILFMVPFTRLVHFIVAPLHYIGRPYQLVRWNWDRKTIRSPASPWSPARPRNN